MAKNRADKELYDRIRASGVRKKVARQLAEVPRQVTNGRRAPKPVRDAVDRLQSVVDELRSHAGLGGSSTPARKPARSRRSAFASRASARKPAGTRRRTSAGRSTSAGKTAGKRRSTSASRAGARKPASTRAKSSARGRSTARTAGGRSGGGRATRARPKS